MNQEGETLIGNSSVSLSGESGGQWTIKISYRIKTRARGQLGGRASAAGRAAAAFTFCSMCCWRVASYGAVRKGRRRQVRQLVGVVVGAAAGGRSGRAGKTVPVVARGGGLGAGGARCPGPRVAPS